MKALSVASLATIVERSMHQTTSTRRVVLRRLNDRFFSRAAAHLLRGFARFSWRLRANARAGVTTEPVQETYRSHRQPRHNASTTRRKLASHEERNMEAEASINEQSLLEMQGVAWGQATCQDGRMWDGYRARAPTPGQVDGPTERSGQTESRSRPDVGQARARVFPGETPRIQVPLALPRPAAPRIDHHPQERGKRPQARSDAAPEVRVTS